MRSSKLLTLALALLSTAAAAQTINDVQQRPGNTQPWGAVINATGSQDVSQYNTSVGSNPTVDAFRFLQGSSAPSATPLFTMSTGGMVAGAATGSRQGAGTINAQGYFLNGVAGTGPPSGPAGGDLTGTYPNPTLAAIGSATGPLGSATVAPIVTIDAKGRVTALGSATITPAIGSITGLGAGCATWLATASSANLRGCLTDESGTGLAYFQGGDIGTPSAGVGTNLTSLNATNLASGTVAAARGGAGTITGALRGSGAGVVTQAACADLTNGSGACAQTYTATTWTPTIRTDATPGTPTYTSQVGSYEQIGRQVTARFIVVISAWGGSPTGNVQIGGLPLTSANVASDFGSCIIVNYALSGTGLAANNNGLNAFISPNTTAGTLQSNGLTASSAITPAQVGTAGTVQFIGICNYHT